MRLRCALIAAMSTVLAAQLSQCSSRQLQSAFIGTLHSQYGQQRALGGQNSSQVGSGQLELVRTFFGKFHLQRRRHFPLSTKRDICDMPLSRLTLPCLRR